MSSKKVPAVAYYRTSSATNVGDDKDSHRRQAAAVAEYAQGRYLVQESFYDAAVSGADPVDTRAGFTALLSCCEAHKVDVVLVENASRFARDLMVQLTGHALLKERGIELIPVDAPTHFTDPTPTAEFVRQVLGAAAQFAKAGLVSTLRVARERKRATTGRCEGPKPVPAEAIAEARRLARRNPVTGKRRSLRDIAKELETLDHLSHAGKQYQANSIRRMLLADVR